MSGFSVIHGGTLISIAEPLLPQNQRRRRLSTAALVTLAFFCVALLSLPFAKEGLNFGKHSWTKEEIALACISHTSFPEVCFSSLSSVATEAKQGQGRDGICQLATDVALEGTKRMQILSSNLHQSFGGNRVQAKAVLSDCKELLDRSRTELELAFHNLKLLSSRYTTSQINDIRTWLSAALAFHTTCTDGLQDVLGGLGNGSLTTEGEYVEKLIRNSLAFVTSMHTGDSVVSDSREWPFYLVNRGTRNHKVQLQEIPENLFPIWMSEEDVDLLQAASPNADVTVAADGSGKYRTVQAAVDAAPSKSSKRYVIYIKSGIYKEQVIIPKSATNLMFIGDGIGATIITGDKNVQQSGVTTFNSATVAVNGNNFLARDITFRNTAGAVNHQAVALRVSADQSAFYKCSMEGYQDTMYAHTLRQFYRECTIYGTVDFIFGDSAAVFQNSRILARVPMKGQQNTCTAQGRTDPNSNTGLSFQGCTVDGVSDLQTAIAQYPTYLGRPWKEYSRTVFLQCYESSVVNPAGWLPWSGDFALKTLYYGEYLCSGPGAGASKRVSWSTQIRDSSVANQFTVANFIGGTQWLPSTSFPYQASL
eukprot:c23229_g1_i1 orf=274-2049(-)